MNNGPISDQTVHHFEINQKKIAQHKIFSHARDYGVQALTIDLLTSHFDPKWVAIVDSEVITPELKNAALGMYCTSSKTYRQMLVLQEQGILAHVEALRNASISLEAHKFTARCIAAGVHGNINADQARRAQLMINEWENYAADQEQIQRLFHDDVLDPVNLKDPDSGFYALYPEIPAKEIASNMSRTWCRQFNLDALALGANSIVLQWMQDMKGPKLRCEEISPDVLDTILSDFSGGSYLRALDFCAGNQDLKILTDQYFRQKCLHAWYARLVANIQVGNFTLNQATEIERYFEDNDELESLTASLHACGFFDKSAHLRVAGQATGPTSAAGASTHHHFTSENFLNLIIQDLKNTRAQELTDALPELFEQKAQSLFDITPGEWSILKLSPTGHDFREGLLMNVDPLHIDIASMPGDQQHYAMECIRSKMAGNAAVMLSAIRLKEIACDPDAWRLMHLAMSSMDRGGIPLLRLQESMDNNIPAKLPLDCDVPLPGTTANDLLRMMHRLQAQISRHLAFNTEIKTPIELSWIEMVNYSCLSSTLQKPWINPIDSHLMSLALPDQQWIQIFENSPQESRSLMIDMYRHIFNMAWCAKARYVHVDDEKWSSIYRAIAPFVDIANMQVNKLKKALSKNMDMPKMWRNIGLPPVEHWSKTH